MEIQLQELIDKIKKDGIESASEEAARVKREAAAEAQRIAEAARKEAEDIIAKAQQDAVRMENAGKAALEQASRNLILAFKGEIQTLLDRLVTQGINSVYGKEDTLKAILPGLLKNWISGGNSGAVDLLLSADDLAKLQSWAQGALAAELQKGIELKSDRNLTAGFRIINKDGSAFYDFSAESAAEQLSAYLNPHLAEILKTSAKGI
jgi:V/A-type H+-transporting ATPase subunit E